MNRKTLFLLSPVLAAVLSMSSLGAKAEQGVSLGSGLVDFTTWNLYGSATANNMTPGNGFTYSTLALTQADTNDSAGAAFAPSPTMLDFDQPFHFDFHFFTAGNGLQGDGLTFTLAREPGFGGGGSALGYDGLQNSVAFAVDTFNFSDEPESPSLQILLNGSTTPLAFTETGLGNGLRESPAQVWAMVDFVPSGNQDGTGVLSGNITVYTDPDDASVFSVYSVEAFVDLSSLAADFPFDGAQPVYYGFTASNGLASDGHYIGSGAPVPEPSTWLMLAAGTLALAGLSRRRLQRQHR